MSVAVEREYGLFIGGETVEPASGELRDLVEPATGETLGRAAMAGEEDVDRAVEAARAALDGPWGKTPPTERSRLLHALADAIVANRKELAELEARNVGKAISSVKAELNQATENFRFYASAIASIAGRSNPIGGSLLFYSLKEPVGVAGQIVPWNYPLTMATWKLAPALAAGCTVVLKPDPQTPLTRAAARRARGRGRVPAGRRQRRSRPTGPRPAPTSSAIPASTRSPSRARRGRAARSCGSAPQPIKRVTLELGGKSPNIVFADANLDDAIPSSVWSIYYAAGQSCEARSRILVERVAYDEFVVALLRARAGAPRRRPARRRDADRLADLDRPPRARARVRRARRRRRAPRRSPAAPCPRGPARSTRRRCSRASSRRWSARARRSSARRDGDAVRGREGRDPARERRRLRADGDGLDGRSGPRPPRRGAGQVRHGRDQHAVLRLPGDPVRRLQAVRLRPRARARDARALPRDEVGARLHGQRGRTTRSGSDAIPLGRPRRRHRGPGRLLDRRHRPGRDHAGAARRVRPLADADRRRPLGRSGSARPSRCSRGGCSPTGSASARRSRPGSGSAAPASSRRRSRRTS